MFLLYIMLQTIVAWKNVAKFMLNLYSNIGDRKRNVICENKNRNHVKWSVCLKLNKKKWKHHIFVVNAMCKSSLFMYEKYIYIDWVEMPLARNLVHMSYVRVLIKLRSWLKIFWFKQQQQINEDKNRKECYRVHNFAFIQVLNLPLSL